jgi:hypothetical protein
MRHNALCIARCKLPLFLKDFMKLAEIMNMELSKYFSPKKLGIFPVSAAVVGITLYLAGAGTQNG